MESYKKKNFLVDWVIRSSWLDRSHNFGLSYRVIGALIALSFIATATEVLGIGLFLPIFQFIRLDGELDALVADSQLWQYVIDLFSYFNLTPSLIVLLLLSFGFFLSRQIITYIRLIYSTAVQQRLIQEQRNKIFDSYLAADTSYHDSTPVGNLVNIIVTEVNGAISGIMAPLELIVYFIMFIGYLVMLSILSWQMTVFSVVAIIIAGIMPKVWIKQSARVGRKLVDANLSMSEFLVGRLRSPSLVRLSGTELAEKKELSRLTLVQRKQVVINSILQSKTEVVMEPIIIALSLVFLYVAYSVLQLQIEVIGLYLVIVMRLMPVAKSVVKQAQVIQSSLGSIEALEGRFKEMNKAFEKNNGNKVLKEVKNSILIDNVSFHYPNDKSNALNDITVEFKPNTMIAIVGPSGGGKSTLIDLLPRLRMPSKGSIQIDGENIEGYTLESLRKLIAYVPQLPQIFNGTIRDHILYGKNDATEDEIERALYFSGAKEFVDRLPKGLDTLLGEDAVKVSGGQRQRLDLARALVKNAEILIMDEPTSNLDVESEERFNDVLTQIRKKTKTTIIIISHRLSSVVDSDQIIVLNQSRIEAIGTHNDLLKQKGWYAKAWNVQK